MQRRSWIRGSVIVPCSIICAYHSAHAQQAAGDLDEIVVNGIRRGDLVLPTTVTSTSAYGWISA